MRFKLYAKLMACSALLPFMASAQVDGDYRSISSAPSWQTVAAWQKYNGTSSSWNAATAYPGYTANVTIQSGDTITLGSSGGQCKTLTVETGAALLSSGTSFSVQQDIKVYGAFVVNNGLIGGPSPADYMNMDVEGSGIAFTLSGTGYTRINRVRAVGSLVGSSINIAQNAIFTNESSTGGSAVGLTGYYNSGSSSDADNDTVNINAGDTATFENGAVLHYASVTTGQPGGTYIVNINGVADESASFGNTDFIPNSNNAASLLVVNVNNLLKLGAGLNLVTTGTGSTFGTATLNIASGATVDASATIRMTAGTATFIMADGTSMMKRIIGAADSLYPISLAANGYNAVTLFNTGTPETFTVKLKNTFDIPPADVTKAVQRQWNITEGTPGVGNDTIQLAWLTADENVSFTPGSASIFNVSGTGVVTEYHGTVTGTGVLGDPYIIKAGGITHFGEFYVANASPTSVTSINAATSSVKVYPNPVNDKQIHLQMTGQEAGTYQVSVMNAMGQVVYNGKVTHTGNTTDHSISLGNEVVPGYYGLQVNGGNYTTTVNVVIR